MPSAPTWRPRWGSEPAGPGRRPASCLPQGAGRRARPDRSCLIEPSGYWQPPEDQDPGPHCFRVAFDHWGVDDIRGTGCPDPFVAVGAPPSSRPETAANAEEVIWSVLTALPADLPSEDEIAAEVTALLDPHPNGVTPLAEVTVHVEDGSWPSPPGARTTA